jgi:hypothetical protein
MVWQILVVVAVVADFQVTLTSHLVLEDLG